MAYVESDYYTYCAEISAVKSRTHGVSIRIYHIIMILRNVRMHYYSEGSKRLQTRPCEEHLLEVVCNPPLYQIAGILYF